MNFTSTPIADLILIEPRIYQDERGYFFESYRKERFAEAGITFDFVQDNQSSSAKGVLRGLHYQIQHPQGKLVRVVSGEIFDVVVDIRKKSPTFGKWFGDYLSAANKRMLWVPAGFAHGFYVTSSEAEVVYKTTDYYAPRWERTILWKDPAIGIDWPVGNAAPIISTKDEAGKLLGDAEVFEDLM